MDPIAIVGFAALGVLVLLWLVISFSARGARREALEWLAAFCLYVSLCMFFLNLVRNAVEAGNTLALVAFGFLGVVFVCGGCVSLVNVVRCLGRSSGPSKAQASATN